MRKLIFFIILVFSYSILSCGQQPKTSFFGENKFEKPVSIPDEILRVLTEDEVFKRCFGSGTDIKDFGKWLEATEINLNDDGLSDVLVKGIDNIEKRKSNCINGNAISFWVFAGNDTGYSLVSENLYTIKVEIAESKTQNFYNIKTFRNTGSRTYIRTYIFDGLQYILKSKEEFPFEELKN